MFLFRHSRNFTMFVQPNLYILVQPELWLAPLQVARATSAATFSVATGLAPLLFKIDSAATSAASILTTFKRCANR